MLQAAPSPLWLELVRAFGGPVLAAIFVVVGLIWKDFIERRNAAQDWFEETYIEKGVDVLISHLAVLCHSINEARRLSIGFTAKPFSSGVTRKLFTVVPIEFLAAVDTAEAIVLGFGRAEHPIVPTDEETMEVLQFCVALSVCAEALRQSLLTIRIEKKSDVYKIAKEPEYVAATKDLLTNFLEGIDLNRFHFGLQEKFRKRILASALALKRAKTSPKAT